MRVKFIIAEIPTTKPWCGTTVQIFHNVCIQKNICRRKNYRIKLLILQKIVKIIPDG